MQEADRALLDRAARTVKQLTRRRDEIIELRERYAASCYRAIGPRRREALRARLRAACDRALLET